MNVLFQDEARFGRLSEPRDCWAPAKYRPDIPAQVVREYTYVYGTVCPFDGSTCYLILPAMDGACMNVFLGELATRYADYYMLIVYDGAPCHSPGVLSIPENMRLVKLPPHSPQLNPVENNWDDMRETFFHNRTFDSMKAVEDQLVMACRHYELQAETIQSMTAWDWIVNY